MLDSVYLVILLILVDEAQVDGCFSLSGDSVNLDARLVHVCAQHTTGSEIILDTPDRTLR
jgi:hypothetical protein